MPKQIDGKVTKPQNNMDMEHLENVLFVYFFNIKNMFAHRYYSQMESI